MSAGVRLFDEIALTHLFRRLASLVFTAIFFGVLSISAYEVTAARAEPDGDAVVRLSELSREAESISEAVNAARIDFDVKLTEQHNAERLLAADESASRAAESSVLRYRASVDKIVSAEYMGGNTSGYRAVFTSDSPQGLIDQLSVQMAIGEGIRQRLDAYDAAVGVRGAALRASRDAADKAHAAADQAASVRSALQAKQGQLQVQIAIVKAQYGRLTQIQRAAVASPSTALQAESDTQSVKEAGFDGSSARVKAMAAALTRVGSPFVWGAAGPNAFDCSGLVQWAYGQEGVSLPHSSQALARGGAPIGLSDLLPGDLITFYDDASHVGIYVGDGMMVHASTFGQPVKVVPITASGPIYNARRY